MGKVEDFEFGGQTEDLNITEKREEELTLKIKDFVSRGNVPLFKLLQVGKNEKEINYLLEWTSKNNIKVTGTEISLSGEFCNYTHISKMGQTLLPDVLEKDEEQKLFLELEKLKKSGKSKDDNEYKKIRSKLIEGNMKLAAWAVYKQFGKEKRESKDDLNQTAMVGLIKAVDDYDISKGYAFPTYAIGKIFYTVANSLNGVDKSYRVLNHKGLEAKKNKYLKIEEDMLKELNREPTKEEVQDLLGLGDERYNQLIAYINDSNRESLEELSEKDKNKKIDELLDSESVRVEDVDEMPITNGIYMDEDKEEMEASENTENIVSRVLAKEYIFITLGDLKELERQVIERRFGLIDDFDRLLGDVRDENPKSLEEVAHDFRVSRERIRQIEIKALRKLRNPRRTENLKDFLDSFGYEDNYPYTKICINKVKKEKVNENLEEICKKNSRIPSYFFNEYEMSNCESKKHKENEKNEENEEKYSDIENIENNELKEKQYKENENIQIPENSDKENIEVYEQISEAIDEVNTKNDDELYLDGISELLNELDELDKMIKQTSFKIEKEEIRKKKNKEIRDKFQRVKKIINNENGKKENHEDNR